MRTVCLPTVYVSVATTRYQYCGVGIPTPSPWVYLPPPEGTWYQRYLPPTPLGQIDRHL